jgi:hypothetical protein
MRSPSRVSAFSIGTTASAPAGMGAPVAIATDRLAHPDRRLRPLPDHRVADDLELGRVGRRRFGDVRRAERVAVHRGGGELRKIHRREDVLGRHTPIGIGQRKLQRPERLDPRKDPLARFVEGDQALRCVVIVRMPLGHAGSLPRHPEGIDRWASGLR